MKKKLIIFIMLLLILFAAGIVILINYNYKSFNADIVKINDIVKTAEENWNDNDKIIKSAEKYEYSISIFDKDKNIILKNEDAPKTITEAYQYRDSVNIITKNNMVNGYVVIGDGYDRVYKEYRNHLLETYVVIIGIIIICIILFCTYIYRRIISPFTKLSDFASNIAMGKLDTPLNMDKDNIFGEFTQSFDIMREELNASKEREKQIEQSKKELIASLSHDIKTPTASIRATSELLQVMIQDEKVQNKLLGIQIKADQIEALINNLFNATLEELQQLKVMPKEESSTIISKLIKSIDFSGYVQPFSVPSCIIMCDKLRLSQVFDNIIGNSYKYAGTPIYIQSDIYDNTLRISINDLGKPLSEEEIIKSVEKYYRGSNSKGKNGSGIGLYISNYFMQKMGGGLEVSNNKGFCVTIYIPLA